MCCRSRHKPKIDIVLVKSSQFDELIAAESHPGAGSSSSVGVALSEAAPEPPIPAGPVPSLTPPAYPLLDGPVPDGPATFVTESTSSQEEESQVLGNSHQSSHRNSLDASQNEVTVTLEGQDGSRIGPIHISQAPSRGRPSAPSGHTRPPGSSQSKHMPYRAQSSLLV